MLQIVLSLTDLDIIERALAIAIESGQIPNPDLLGDAKRVVALRQSLLTQHDDYLKDIWGESRSRS
jgi:hypothetical protein